jgi:hypothetical protein
VGVEPGAVDEEGDVVGEVEEDGDGGERGEEEEEGVYVVALARAFTSEAEGILER